MSAPEFLHKTANDWSSVFDNDIVDENVLVEPVYNELTCCTTEAGDDTSDLLHDNDDGQTAENKIVNIF